MKKIKPTWNVLFIGGAAGTGKTTIANHLASYYDVSIIHVDDIFDRVHAASTKEEYANIHFWDDGKDFRNFSIEENVHWLIETSKEMTNIMSERIEKLKNESQSVIIEGDFIYPEFTTSFSSEEVKTIYIIEHDVNQFQKNFYSREAKAQRFRSNISMEYGIWLRKQCDKYSIPVVEARPWESLTQRSIDTIGR